MRAERTWNAAWFDFWADGRPGFKEYNMEGVTGAEDAGSGGFKEGGTVCSYPRRLFRGSSAPRLWTGSDEKILEIHTRPIQLPYSKGRAKTLRPSSFLSLLSQTAIGHKGVPKNEKFFIESQTLKLYSLFELWGKIPISTVKPFFFSKSSHNNPLHLSHWWKII